MPPLVILEPTQWNLRIHPSSGEVVTLMGSASVTMDALQVATIRGLVTTEPFTPAMALSIEDALRDIGATSILWQRWVDGQKRTIKRSVAPHQGKEP